MPTVFRCARSRCPCPWPPAPCRRWAAPDAVLKAAAEKAQPAVIESLREMVLIESGSSDRAGLARMAALLEARLQALGFKDRAPPRR